MKKNLYWFIIILIVFISCEHKHNEISLNRNNVNIEPIDITILDTISSDEIKGYSYNSDSVIVPKDTSTFILYSKKECLQTKLSNKYDYKISCVVKKDTLYSNYYIARVKVLISEKGKNIFKLKVNKLYPGLCFITFFEDCNQFRSLTTKYLNEVEIVDNYLGDFVVADFNFDNKEDFAIRTYFYSNGGPYYEYFLQTDNQKFIKDSFLSDEMIFFPSKFDFKNKRLINYVHASVHGVHENIYQLLKNGKWEYVQSEYIGD